jgi:hypothetical protein
VVTAAQLSFTWGGGWHCAACQAEGEALLAQYRAAQARGEYDAEGYTPAERRAQQRRVSRGGR